VADSVVPITAGTGTDIKTFIDATFDHVQYFRSHTCTAVTLDSWTVSATAVTSRVAADETRVALVFTNTATVDVFIRPDATAPTSTVYFMKLSPGDMYEVPREWVELAWSVVGATAPSGVLNIWKGTAA
jgi:hypothetical protein